MQDMSGRAPFTSPLTTQQRSDAQISNPATPITPTAPLEATQAPEPMKTVDPSNGGITPSTRSPGGFDINALNRGLATAGGGSAGGLGEAYGITGGGISMDEVGGMPSFISGPDKSIYEKKVVSSTKSMDPTKEQKFLQDMNSIDLAKKKPNSGAGIHPDTNGAFADTIDLADGFMSSPQLMSNKELLGNGAVAKFKQAYDAFGQLLKDVQKMPADQRADYLSAATGELKMAMRPILDKAKGIVYAQAGGRTGQFDRLNDFSKQLDSYAKLYTASADDIQGTIKAYNEQSQKYSVAFTKLDFTQKSENAKTRLKNNPAYAGFMDLMMQANPEKSAIIKNMYESSTVTDEEKNFLEDKFIGGSFKELFDARSQAIKDFGPSAAAWFKDFDQIIQVKNELYKTRMDDVLEDMRAPVVDYNKLNFNAIAGY